MRFYYLVQRGNLYYFQCRVPTDIKQYFLGTSAAFWLGLQADYDTEEVERSMATELDRIHPWKMAA